MGTDPAGPGGIAPDGAGRPGTGPAHRGDPDPVVRRRLGILQWVLGAVLVVFLVGLGMLARPLVADDPGFLPSGPGLAQLGIGVALVVAGTAVYVRSMTRVARRPSGVTAMLPRPVRRAVLRREAVPERYRADVVATLDQVRAMWPFVVAPMVYMAGMGLVMNAGAAPGRTGALTMFGLYAGGYLLVVGVPLALTRRWLVRTRRRYAAAA